MKWIRWGGRKGRVEGGSGEEAKGRVKVMVKEGTGGEGRRKGTRVK